MVGWCVMGMPRGGLRQVQPSGDQGEDSAPGSKCFFLSSGPIRLKLKFKRGSLPPTMPLEFVGCIGGCDETLREILNLRFSQGPPRACPPASQPSGYLQASQSLNRMDSSQHSHPQPPDTRQPRPLKALVQNLPPATAAGENDSVVCNCGQEAVLLTVRKEGPNQGRQFYKCPAGSCSFFLWASGSRPDPPSSAPRPPGGSLGRPTGSGNRPGGVGGPGDDSGSGTSCLCSQAAVTRTVQKDGPNKGRQFHTCAKPRAQQCGFFQWVDENVAPGEERPPPQRPCREQWAGWGGRTGPAQRPQSCEMGCEHEVGLLFHLHPKTKGARRESSSLLSARHHAKSTTHPPSSPGKPVVTVTHVRK